MCNQNNSKEYTGYHIEKMIFNLNNNKTISKEVCEQVEQELKDLYNVRNEQLKKHAMDNKFDVLFSEFCNSADESKQFLNRILETVTGGNVPSLNTMQELNSTIEILRDRYEVIRIFANEVLTTEELPQEESSVFGYADAINNSKTLLYKKQIQEVKTLLEHFVMVKSLVAGYAKALEPFQEKASLILAEISKESITVEKAIEDSSDAALFMQTLEYEDCTDLHWVELLREINQKMDIMVQIGLATKQYFLKKPLSDADDLIVDYANDKTVKDKQSSVDVTENTPKNVGVEELSLSIKTENDIIEDTSNTKSEESDFTQAIKKNGLILLNNDDFGTLVEDISPNEDKKLSATIFTNDLRKGNVKAAVNIIKALCRNISITEDALAEDIHINRDLLDITISQLFKKGYIRKYAIKQGEIIAPSPRLKEALSYKSASSFAEVKKNCLADYSAIHKGNENIVASFIAYHNILQHMTRNPDSKTTSTTLHMGNGGFVAQIYNDDNIENSNFIFGEFWNNIDTCDIFIQSAEEQLSTCNSAINIVCAALDFDTAKNFSKVLIDMYNLDTYGATLQLYSLKDNDFREIEESSNNKINNEGSTITAEVTANRAVFLENKSFEKAELDSSIIEETFNNDTTIEEMLADGFFYAAVTYAKADAEIYPEKKMLYKQLKYAFDEPSNNCNYTSTNLYSLISESNDLENALVLSAALRTFFSNQVKYDYDIKSVYGALNDYAILDLIPELRHVIYDMSEFKAYYNTGLNYYADYHKRDHNKLNMELLELRNEATEFYKKNVIGVIKEKTAHKRFLETTKLIFSPTGELGQYLKLIIDDENEIDAKDLVVEFLSENFYKPESIIDDNTIDEEMLWDYIQKFWGVAGQTMAFKKKDDLKGHLRSNIISKVTKAVQILAKWCCLIDMFGEHEEDEGSIAYKKLRTTLLDNISSAIKTLKTEEKDIANSTSLIAGIKVLENTLEEIYECINGTYNECTKRYFYVDFLLTDNIMLDESYIPDIDTHSSALDSLSVQDRILKHLSQIKNTVPAFETRLNEILEDQCDDFGAARLIVDYLSSCNTDINYDNYIVNINDSIAYAKETAELRKTDFIGELELAQSYGQIDNSTEDQKEIILKAINEWFEWADSSKNYGFFKKVIDEYMSDIRRNAKSREKDIFEELNAFELSSDSVLSIDAKERKIAKVRAALKEQNYTVAEDILSRDDFDENNAEALVEVDFLKDFLENYDDFYQPVSAKHYSLANLVRNKTRNKEERGAKRLADNWLPGGSKIGMSRLKALLENLGFDIGEVKEENTIRRFEAYNVFTVGTFKRQRNSYTHPIAALGSGATEAGFRVVCLNGAYNADKLIDLMKQIGNAKHTIMLLDYALSKSERRRLARKTKSDLGDKLFAVLDRTIMMYLIRNYDETKINRMLVSLVTPFAYYQPYVWESANVMPPEIFMGRKLELEKIKSPTGVNIVYGGRQLGKSALLKKAKEDIDWNENGDRAIYIDIKGLDYKETATKISHELVDQFIIKEDLETDNWDTLARALRRRLQSNEEKIPYLLLLLDEADTFIESCSTINYKPFDSLKEIQNVGSGRFKFVVAGLRDIVRFKRNALENNSVLTHLEPMTVTPFKFSEARELMEIPLHYLGLRFPKEKESLITLIMATTNYFPGLIQLYCSKLIDAMRNRDYAGYDEVDSPIYEVSEEHIKKVLADPDFMKQIREKYIITLKLDEDNYYHLIALIMAWLYHNEDHNKGGKSGYSANDIKKVGTDYEITKLSELEISKLENFCEELKELNVLRKTDEHKYLFTRFTFFQMMGTADEVDTALLEYMEA